jgi:hypothetical protein
MRLVFALSLALAAGLAVRPAAAASAEAGAAAARAGRTAHGAEIVRDFATRLAIPDVASDHAGIARNADWIASAFARRGFAMERLKLVGARLRVILPIANFDNNQHAADEKIRRGDFFYGAEADAARLAGAGDAPAPEKMDGR